MPDCAPLNFIRGRKKREPLGTEAAAAAQARLAEGARAGVGELSPAQGADALARAPHGLRGSQLPQHRRVLAPRHGDLHDPRRHLHAVVRLLQRHARHARSRLTPTSRSRSASAIARLALDYVVITSVDRDDLAGLRRVALRAHDRRDAGADSVVPARSAHPRFQGRRGGAAHRARRAAGRAQPQHRDRAAAVSHGAARRPLRPRAAAARSIARPTRRRFRPSPG